MPPAPGPARAAEGVRGPSPKAPQAGRFAGLGNQALLRLRAAAGDALPPRDRAALERGLDAPLGHVRLHTGADGQAAAAAYDARAVTVGADIAFGAGQYAPATRAGQRLIAHEVAHVVQQRRGAALGPRRRIAPRDADTEREAERAADALVDGRRFAIAHAAPIEPALQDHGARAAQPATAQPAAARDTLPTSELGDIVLERVQALQATVPEWGVLLIPILRAELAAPPDAREGAFRARLQRMLDVLAIIEPALALVTPLIDRAQYPPALASAIVAHAQVIRIGLGAALLRAHNGQDPSALVQANLELLTAFPAFLRDQYLSEAGVGRMITDLNRLRQSILDLRGRNHRPSVTRRADNLIALGDPDFHRLGQRFQSVRQRLQRTGDEAATPTTVGASLRDLLVDLGTVQTIANLLAVYEQFEYWRQQLTTGVIASVVDSYRSQAAVAVAMQGRLGGALREFEAIPRGDPRYYERFATAVEHANALLSSPDIPAAQHSIEDRLGTIATANLIGQITLITLAAIVTGGAAGEVAGAALARAGAGLALRAAGTFAVDVTTFTLVNRMATHTLIGPPPAGQDPGFAAELLQNALTFGALRGIGLGLRTAFRVTETSSLAARAALRVGTATVSGLVLQGFTEAQRALGPRGAMSGEERYRSILMTASTIVALELGTVITRPLSVAIAARIRSSVHADLVRRSEALAAQRTALGPRVEELRRGALSPDQIAELLDQMQSLIDGELTLMNESARRGIISADQVREGVARYNEMIARLELRLARAGVDATVRAGGPPAFRLVWLGVVAFTPEALEALRTAYSQTGYSLAARPGHPGEFVGRTPAGEVTYFIPAEAVPTAAPDEAAVAGAPARAAALVAGDEIAADGLARLNQLGFGPRRLAEILGRFTDEALLVDFLRLIGRFPDAFSVTSSRMFNGIANFPAAVAFGRAFGARMLVRFWLNFGSRPNRAALLEATRAYLSDPSVTPEVRQQRRAQLVDLANEPQFERLIGTAPPPPPRPARPTAATLGIDRTDPDWETGRGEERELAGRRGLTLTDAEAAQWADLLQVFARARRGDFRTLSREDRLRVLDEYERRAVAARMPRLLINARRGRLAELFFSPRPGEPQQAFLGRQPVAYSTAGASRPDYQITPEQAAAEGEAGRAFTEFVDLKSDLISSGPVRASDRAFESGVSAARNYVNHAIADLPNLPLGSRISIDFIRPTNAQTRRAMLDILFATNSPIFRVRFGGAAWQVNPAFATTAAGHP